MQNSPIEENSHSSPNSHPQPNQPNQEATAQPDQHEHEEEPIEHTEAIESESIESTEAIECAVSSEWRSGMIGRRVLADGHVGTIRYVGPVEPHLGTRTLAILVLHSFRCLLSFHFQLLLTPSLNISFCIYCFPRWTSHL